jgi:hypothetical protein
MATTEATLVDLAMLLLRLVLPFAITLIFGCTMNRLLARWNSDLEQ